MERRLRAGNRPHRAIVRVRFLLRRLRQGPGEPGGGRTSRVGSAGLLLLPVLLIDQTLLWLRIIAAEARPGFFWLSCKLLMLALVSCPGRGVATCI